MAAVSNSIRKLCVLFQQNDTFHFLPLPLPPGRMAQKLRQRIREKKKRKEIIYSDFC